MNCPTASASVVVIGSGSPITCTGVAILTSLLPHGPEQRIITHHAELTTWVCVLAPLAFSTFASFPQSGQATALPMHWPMGSFSGLVLVNLPFLLLVAAFCR